MRTYDSRKKKSSTAPVVQAEALNTRQRAEMHPLTVQAKSNEEGLAEWEAQRQKWERFGSPWKDKVPNPSGELAQPWIQRKLTLAPPGDKYEKEADRVPSQVVQPINIQKSQIEQFDQESEEALDSALMGTTIQRQGPRDNSGVSSEFESAINSAKGSGQPLDAELQLSIGQLMGADFSGVRVHTDAQSDQLNRSIQARAFTTGQDVFFRKGEYQPGSTDGQQLIAHELTHVVQQKGEVVQRLTKNTPQKPLYGDHSNHLDGISIQRQLVIGEKPIETVEDLDKEIVLKHKGLDGTVEKLINLPKPAVNVTYEALIEVHKYLIDSKEPTDSNAKVALLQLLSHGAWTRTQTSSKAAMPLFNIWNDFRKKALGHLTDLGKFLEENPNVGKHLEAAGVGWDLSSSDTSIEGMGGGAVKDERIKIREWVLSEKGFTRMVVHEAGHATFQRLFITGEEWTEAANIGKEKPSEKALTADGMKFYNAWMEIREHPELFYITEMPGDSSASKKEGRGKYLAGQFTEFCAESFMHLALEKAKLKIHVETLSKEKTTVKKAWNDVVEILTKYEGQLLGKEESEGTIKTLRNDRFQRALSHLKEGLKGPELGEIGIEKVKYALVSLQQAWRALTKDDRDKYRKDAITTLDEYMIKVQRRRPAQDNLGSELGFEGL